MPFPRLEVHYRDGSVGVAESLAQWDALPSTSVMQVNVGSLFVMSGGLQYWVRDVTSLVASIGWHQMAMNATEWWNEQVIDLIAGLVSTENDLLATPALASTKTA